MFLLPHRARPLLLLALGLLMLFIGPPAMLFDGRRKAKILEEVYQRGKKTMASVLTTSPPYSRNVQVTYAFEVKGRSFHNTEEVSRTIMDLARNRGQLEVLYFIADPNVSTVDPERLTRSSKRLLSWGPWGIGIFGLSLTVYGMRLIRATPPASLKLKG